MDYRQVFQDIQTEQWSGAYLFFGEEEYVKEQALDKALDALVPENFRDLNYQMIDGSEVELDSIINACETLPFLSQKRLVVVKDFFLIDGIKGTREQEEQMLNYIKDIHNTTCLIFYCHGKIDKRKSIYKYIKKTGKVYEFSHLKTYDLIQWVTQTLKKHEKKMTLQCMNYFVEKTGNDLEDVSNELSKLIDYTGEQDSIDINAIDQVVAPSLEQSIFKLVDAIGEKRSGDALVLLKELLYGGQAVFPVLTMVARQFRLIMQCKGYYEKGYSANTIADKLGQRAFVVKKCIAQGGNFTMNQLKNGLSLCLEVDYGMKSGKIKDVTGLELLIIKMCNT